MDQTKGEVWMREKDVEIHGVKEWRASCCSEWTKNRGNS